MKTSRKQRKVLNNIYKEIARKNKVSKRQVISDINAGIQTAWNSVNPNSLESIYQQIYFDGTPSADELILKCANGIKKSVL